MDALSLLKDDDENVNRSDKNREIDLSVSGGDLILVIVLNNKESKKQFRQFIQLLIQLSIR